MDAHQGLERNQQDSQIPARPHSHLADRVKRLERKIPGMWPYMTSILGDGEGSPRIRAISVIVASGVGLRDEVQSFRDAHLPGDLLAADDIDEWMASLPESQGDPAPAEWITNIPRDKLIQIADGSAIIPADLLAQARANVIREWDVKDRTEKIDAPAVEQRALIYATPDLPANESWKSWPIPLAGGTLDTLRSLSYALVEVGAGWWTRWHAATFILTGYAPLVPEEVAPLPARSGRRQTEKHLQLAAFVMQRATGPQQFFSLLGEWNAMYPEWAFKNTTNFGYEARQAWKRLESQIMYHTGKTGVEED